MIADTNSTLQSNLTTHIDSLKYAKIIQEGLLPKPRHFERLFSNHFILYKPLNYVSGDFYWVAQKDDLIYLAVGDCTGHGVPGAMLSVLAKSTIEYSILNKGLSNTAEILDEVDKKFVESFSGVEEGNYNNDWFDVGLICINTKNNQVTFSAANRKLLHVSKGQFSIHKGDKFPIGGWQYTDRTKFSALTFDYEEGDLLYLGSDGFQDQIGGKRLKKFTSKRLHSFLADISYLPCPLQKELLEDEFDRWKKNNDQIDDVCIVAVEL